MIPEVLQLAVAFVLKPLHDAVVHAVELQKLGVVRHDRLNQQRHWRENQTQLVG